ncbi:MAG: trans-2-enoyl-CoA reductase [Cognaticolwellia sp.]|jgi:trans-2-enoyl-CoA reductase
MHALTLIAHGAPAQALQLQPQIRPHPAPGELLVRVLASPIDPADVLVVAGHYPVLPQFGTIPGLEGVGRVEAVGEGVDDAWLGSLTLLPMRSSPWATWACVPRSTSLQLPDLDPIQACMLRLNPPSALDLIDGLAPGSWLIQSPGAGAVGQCIIQLARTRGLHTVSLIRRESRRERLESLGADAVFHQDTKGLRRQVRALIDGAPLTRAIDGSGGPVVDRMASCLDPGGEVLCYGSASRQPAQLSVRNSVFNDISMRGYWLYRENAKRPHAESARLLALAEEMQAGRLDLQVAGVFPLQDWEAAFDLARSGERFGRVVLQP